MHAGAAPAAFSQLDTPPEAKNWSVAFMVHNFPLLSETFIATLAEAIIPHVGDFRILATGGEVHPPPHHSVVERAGLLDRLHVSARTGRINPLDMAAIAAAHPGKSAWLAALTAFDLLPGRHRTAMSRMLSRQPEFDVMHCQFGYEGLAALRHRRFGTLRAKVFICHLRGSDITRHVRENGEDVYAGLFAEAELLMANCEYFRQAAIGLGADPDKVVVVGSPIDTERFVPPAAPREPYADRPLRLAAVGRLVEKKGFGDAIAAMAQLGDLEANLDIYGDGPLRSKLEQQVRELNLENRVHFHGAVTADQIIEGFYRSDIALAPSVKAADGDSDAPVNTLKEAMATELPVVATEHGGIPELVEPGINGFLVPERAPQALASRIRELATLSERWPEMGAQGRRKVIEEYGIKRVTEKTLAAYKYAFDRKDGS